MTVVAAVPTTRSTGAAPSSTAPRNRLREAPSSSGRRSRPGGAVADEEQVVLDRLAEPDAGVEHDLLLLTPRAHREGQALFEKRPHLVDDVLVVRVLLHGARLALHVHEAQGAAAPGGHAGELRVEAQSADVVDHAAPAPSARRATSAL